MTFLIVFLIQNTQNRDAEAMQLKLDELIRVAGKARNKLVDLEDLSEDEIRELEFQKIRQRSEAKLAKKKTRKIKSKPTQPKLPHLPSLPAAQISA